MKANGGTDPGRWAAVLAIEPLVTQDQQAVPPLRPQASANSGLVILAALLALQWASLTYRGPSLHLRGSSWGPYSAV